MRSTTALAFALAFFSSNAQWAGPGVNTPARTGTGLDAATPLTSAGPDGSTYISWFDNQPGGYQLRMQRLDVNGYRMWSDAGLLVSDHPQNSALFRYDLKTDHSGNAVVAFQDERSGQLDIVAYMVSPTGDMLWGADGIALTDAGAAQGLGPVIGFSGNNVVIAWNANDGGSAKWIPYQLISPEGVPQWAAPHQVIGTAKYSRPKVVSTFDGFLLFYVEETGNFPFISNMYVQRFDSTGTALWAQPTHVSSKTISVFYFPQPVSDGHNGMYLAFTTSNPDNATLSDVYLQRVKGDGSTWSGTGTELLTGTATQRFGGPLAFMNEMMGLLVPVQVTNTAQSQGGWNVQLVDTLGVTHLGPDGVVVIAPSAQLATPDAIANTGTGGIVLYSEGGFGQEHLRATNVGYQGNQVWGGPVDVCTVNSNKDDANMTPLFTQTVAVWQDDRSGSGIYAQNIFADGTVGPVGIAVHPADVDQLRIEEHADGAVLALTSASRDAGRVEITDALGRACWSMSFRGGQSVERITLPAERLAAGTYLVRVVHADRAAAVRWLRR